MHEGLERILKDNRCHPVSHCSARKRLKPQTLTPQLSQLRCEDARYTGSAPWHGERSCGKDLWFVWWFTILNDAAVFMLCSELCMPSLYERNEYLANQRMQWHCSVNDDLNRTISLADCSDCITDLYYVLLCSDMQVMLKTTRWLWLWLDT